QASAAAWLPVECVTTPRAASSSLSENTAFVAPRILNDPVFWKLSHLKKSRAPAIASSEVEVSTGVRWMCGAMRACAAAIACSSGEKRVNGLGLGVACISGLDAAAEKVVLA